MMGHIHNLLLKMVSRHHGKEGIDRLISLSGLTKRDYRPEVVYPEEEFQALYKATKELYGVDDGAAQKAFAEYFIEVSPQLFPAIFKEAGNARRLLEMVPIIHKQWPSAASAGNFREKVWIIKSVEDRLIFKYESPNHLCGVLRYVAEGVLRHFNESGTVTETQCSLKGAPWCEVEVRFGHSAAST